MSETLEITVKPSGQKHTVTVSNGQTILVDRIALGSADDRRKLINAVIEKAPGLDRAALEKTLLDKAAEDAKRDPKDDAKALHQANEPEVDIARIVRPEAFITTDVSGFCIPTAIRQDGETVGRWKIHLRWADGRREARDLSNAIELAGGSRLFIHPVPMPPSPSLRPEWSALSRTEWLKGHSAPDAAAVFGALCKAIADYVDFPSGKAAGNTAVLALFILFTYIFHAWDAVPYLYVGGPINSGKTRIFELLDRLVFRPLLSSNLTSATMFRTLHERGGVLLLDEAERLKERTPDVAELLSILLAGYKRGGKAQRLKPETFELQEFDVFGPKAIACIAGLPAALASRCIPLLMFRCPPDSQKPKRRLDDEAGRWAALRDDLHILALENGATILNLSRRSEVCPSMTGRNYELWQPLLALASWIESCGARGLLRLMQDHAAALIAETQEDATPDTDETLLRMLAGLVTAGCTPGPKDILKAARDDDGEAFTKMTAKGVSTILKRYGFRTLKSHGTKVYRVPLEELRHVQTTYHLDLNPTQG